MIRDRYNYDYQEISLLNVEDFVIDYMPPYSDSEAFRYIESEFYRSRVHRGYTGDPKFIHQRDGKSAWYVWEVDFFSNYFKGPNRGAFRSKRDFNSMHQYDKNSYSTNKNDVISSSSYFNIMSDYVVIKISESFVNSAVMSVVPSKISRDCYRFPRSLDDLFSEVGYYFTERIRGITECNDVYKIIGSTFMPAVPENRINMRLRTEDYFNHGYPVLFKNIDMAVDQMSCIYEIFCSNIEGWVRSHIDRNLGRIERSVAQMASNNDGFTKIPRLDK